jgi:hypothetical protein
MEPFAKDRALLQEDEINERSDLAFAIWKSALA